MIAFSLCNGGLALEREDGLYHLRQGRIERPVNQSVGGIIYNIGLAAIAAAVASVILSAAVFLRDETLRASTVLHGDKGALKVLRISQGYALIVVLLSFGYALVSRLVGS
jgi:hypothetical protein